MTPNGDGRNDRFVIRNLLLYDSRAIIIKNRWGRTVYESTNYNNDWDGENVPDGVYFGRLETITQNELVNISFTVTILHN
jgi:gliding motility-associated-like protein